MALLEVNNLSIALPDAESGRWLPVVNHIHFSLYAGGITALVGESGSGKSLTARALLGLTPTTARLSGELRLRGLAMHQWSEKQWRQHRGRELAMIFQDPLLALNPLRRIGSQMAEVLARHQYLARPARHEVLIQALQRVRLERADALLNAFPHQLSGGMRQRVMIAMALLGKPQILLADEPTAALDPTTRSSVLTELLRARKDTGCAILLISHDLSLVEQFSDDILIMYAGRIVERGDAATVLRRPRHPYTAALIAARPRLQSRQTGPLTVIPGQFNSRDRHVAGCVFAPRCPRASEQCREQQPRWTTLASDSDNASSHHSDAHGATPGFACHHPLVVTS